MKKKKLTQQEIIAETIGRDASQKRKLNPPNFPVETVSFNNPWIAWGQTLERYGR